MHQLVDSAEENEAEKKIIYRCARKEYLAQEAPEKFIHHVRDTADVEGLQKAKLSEITHLDSRDQSQNPTTPAEAL